MQLNPYLNFDGNCAAAFKFVDQFGTPWMINCEGEAR